MENKLQNIQKLFAEVLITKKFCIERTLGLETNKYSRIMINGKRHGAHRLSWECHFGKIPKDKSVCHKCDNPSCINPNHLFLGTQSENLIDCVLKKRHPSSKLSPDKVKQIRTMLKTNSLREIAIKFGVAHRTIWDLKNRTNWAHV